MPESHLPQLVRDLMTVGVVTWPPKTTVSEPAQIFLEQCMDEIIVLDEGKALGVVGQLGTFLQKRDKARKKNISREE